MGDGRTVACISSLVRTPRLSCSLWHSLVLAEKDAQVRGCALLGGCYKSDHLQCSNAEECCDV